MSIPKVNVLIATYNYGPYLVDAINSAVGQTFPNKMITVVDDCSTDDTDNIIHSMCKLTASFVCEEYSVFTGNIHNVQFIYITLKKNSGPSYARNVGINVTKQYCEYFQILDADDIMLPTKIEELTKAAIEFNAGVVYGDYNIYNVDTKVTLTEYKEPFSFQRLMKECIVHSGSLILTQALEECADQYGFYDINMRTCEDYDLWIRIAEKFMIIHVPKPLTIVRTHTQNSTHVVDKNIWNQNWHRIGEKMKDRHGR